MVTTEKTSKKIFIFSYLRGAPSVKVSEKVLLKILSMTSIFHENPKTVTFNFSLMPVI